MCHPAPLKQADLDGNLGSRGEGGDSRRPNSRNEGRPLRSDIQARFLRKHRRGPSDHSHASPTGSGSVGSMSETSAPMPRDRVFLLTGLPRSGTTYLAAVLHEPPRVICQSEARGAWKRAWRADADDSEILRILASLRGDVAQGRPMPTFEGTAGYRGEGRVDTWNQPKQDRVVDADPGFHFGAKNPEIFLDWLPRWRRLGFRVVVTLRHPAAVINSWLGRRAARLAAGRSVEGVFGNGEATTFTAPEGDPLDRCIALHEHLSRSIVDHVEDDGVLLVRYDHWFTDHDLIGGIRRFLGLPESGPPSPAPMRPEPPRHISASDVERIRVGCVHAEALGFDRTPSGWAESII